MTDKEKKTKPGNQKAEKPVKPVNPPKANPKAEKPKAEPVDAPIVPETPIVPPVPDELPDGNDQPVEKMVPESPAVVMSAGEPAVVEEGATIRMVLMRNVGYLPAQSIIRLDPKTAEKYEARGIARREEV